MTPLETSLEQAGLELTGTGVKLSAFGPHWLHDSPLLEDFTLEEADIVGAGMLGVRARAGQVLMAEGQVGDWMLLVLSGTVDVTRRVGAENEEVTRLAVIRAGAAVGEMSMLDGEPRYASCTAIDAVEFAVLTRQAMARLIRDHPAVGAKLLVKITQLLAQRLRNTTQQLTRLLDSRRGLGAADSAEIRAL
jgi:CRP-like cAMP-binding protein